ncbi:zf-HC2 domain-containing protein [Neisseria wadsworthii]|uniref:Putative zinc-finger domain-containing protein n=1 Tax=Neisseria wadsworthii 9715 TaxID=1030841 RepID=G4CNZ1_9NEIS|nr:zf-HC2 domain-containing protein [Neisseria wadsworthii]EGZ48941.1 hypothetical protein HMPREF9370_0800 [Neisseria wadsworthii 9715]
MLIKCKEACRLLSEQQDRPLSVQEHITLRLHLAYCSHCRKYSRQMQQISDSMQAWVKHLSEEEQNK